MFDLSDLFEEMAMRRFFSALTVASIVVAGAASAQTSALKPQLSGMSFLVGNWDSGTGKVAQTGESASGSSSIEPAANGAVLLRRDHTELFGVDGKPTGSFEQIMLIYPEGGTLHADYSDGDHVIHYTSADVEAGKSVVFSTQMSAGAPSFRLRYEAIGGDTLSVRFEMAAPGQTTFHAIATGTLHKHA